MQSLSVASKNKQPVQCHFITSDGPIKFFSFKTWLFPYKQAYIQGTAFFVLLQIETAYSQSVIFWTQTDKTMNIAVLPTMIFSPRMIAKEVCFVTETINVHIGCL